MSTIADLRQLDSIRSLNRREGAKPVEEQPLVPLDPQEEVSLKEQEDKQEARHLRQQRELQMAAVSRDNLIDVHTMEKAALSRFGAYQKVDNQPGVDGEGTPGLVQARSQDGSVHQAIVVDAMNGYQMHLRVIGPDGEVRNRTFANIGYVYDNQRMGHLAQFNSVTLVTEPGQEPRGEVCTTSHPMARASASGGSGPVTSIKGNQMELPSYAVRVDMGADEARGQVAQFDEIFDSTWNEAAAFYRNARDEQNLDVDPEVLDQWNLANQG